LLNVKKQTKMKKKNLLMTAVAIFGLATITMAQTVPSYVPTTGLVGWWPFTGNANDESGNGNNGTVNGAVLTSDRFSNVNKAYNFDGIDDYILLDSLNNIQYKPITYSIWVNADSLETIIYPLGGGRVIIGRDQSGYYDQGAVMIYHYPAGGTDNEFSYYIGQSESHSNYTPPLNIWTHFVFTINAMDSVKFYINSNLVSQQYYPTAGNANINFLIGAGNGRFFWNGKLDDIGVWNRDLNQQEITDLYNGCQLSVSTQPINQSVNISNNAQFTTASSDSLATYQWQTNLGVGFQNLNSVGQYRGTANDTLTIANTTLSNNNQPFRCIVSSGSCTDTSAVAVLTVVNNVGINEFTHDNLFSVYPNPAHSQINVKADAKLLGSVYTIYDNTGKLVLTGKINSDNTVIELGNLSGGIYLFSVGENLKQTFKVIKE
jgi:hypothetical protein